jgi:hypothetical protein
VSGTELNTQCPIIGNTYLDLDCNFIEVVQFNYNNPSIPKNEFVSSNTEPNNYPMLNAIIFDIEATDKDNPVLKHPQLSAYQSHEVQLEAI